MDFIDKIVFPLWTRFAELLSLGESDGVGQDENADRVYSPAQIALQYLKKNREYYNELAQQPVESSLPSAKK